MGGGSTSVTEQTAPAATGGDCVTVPPPGTASGVLMPGVAALGEQCVVVLNVAGFATPSVLTTTLCTTSVPWWTTFAHFIAMLSTCGPAAPDTADSSASVSDEPAATLNVKLFCSHRPSVVVTPGRL